MKNLEQLKETYKKLGKEIKEIENLKIDFSKWIGRYNTALTIKGDKHLVSYKDGDISYTKNNVCCSDDTINYEYTTLDKLKEGDVFICECDLVNIELCLFRIHQGKLNDGTFINQHIKKICGLEYITHYFNVSGKQKVIKFLRN